MRLDHADIRAHRVGLERSVKRRAQGVLLDWIVRLSVIAREVIAIKRRETAPAMLVSEI